MPLLERLEDEGDGTHIRAIQLAQHLDGLGVVLARWPANKGEAGEIDHGVDDGIPGRVVEELLDGPGEIEAARVDAHDTGAARFKLGDQGDVVRVILGVDVGLRRAEANGLGGCSQRPPQSMVPTFWRIMPTTGESVVEMPASGQKSLLYQSKYDWGVSKTISGATGCQMACGEKQSKKQRGVSWGYFVG